jgi:hypothetical protein
MNGITACMKKGSFLLTDFWIVVKRDCSIIIKRNGMIENLDSNVLFGYVVAVEDIFVCIHHFFVPMAFYETDTFELEITEHGGPFEYKLITEPIEVTPNPKPVTR